MSLAVGAGLRRDVNCASQEEDRSGRRRALERIRDAFFGKRPEENLEVAGARSRVLEEVLLLALLARFGDSVEKCREIAIETVTRFLQEDLDSRKEGENDHRRLSESVIVSLAGEVVSQVDGRLDGSPFPEEAEELRLALMELLELILLHPAARSVVEREFEAIVRIIAGTSADNFPENKRQCAKCCIRLCREFPDRVHFSLEELLNPLVLNLGHQRAKVRQLSLEAIKLLVLRSADKSANFEELMAEKILPAIKTVNHDGSSNVRVQGLQLISELLCSMPNADQYRKDFLPILLFGLADSAKDIQELARTTIEDVGKRLVSSSSGAATDDNSSLKVTDFPEPFKSRPGKGARSIVVDALPAVLPKLFLEARDWTAQERFRAVSLIKCVIIYAEDNIESFVPQLLTTLSQASTDDEAQVREAAIEAAKLLGRYVTIGSVLRSLLPFCLGKASASNQGEESQTAEEAQSFRVGALSVLAAVLLGFDKEEDREDAFEPKAIDVARMLNDTSWEDALDGNIELQCQLFLVINSLLERSYYSKANLSLNVCSMILRMLFLLITCAGQHEDPESFEKASNESIILLAACGGFLDSRNELPDVPKLTQASCPLLLDGIALDYCENWSKGTFDRRVFDEVVRKTGAAGLQLCGRLSFVIDVLGRSTSMKCDPNLRLSMLALLETLISQQCSSTLDEFVSILVQETLLPNLVWRAGRVPSTIRKISAYCFAHLVEATDMASWFLDELPELLPTMKACLDDMEVRTRKFSLMAFFNLFDQLKRKRLFIDAFLFAEVYHDFVKRLDDADDSVRILAAQTISLLIELTPKEAVKGTPAGYISDTAFLHLDDASDDVRQAVKSIVVALLTADVDSENIKEKAATHSERHRNPELCNEILAEFK